MNKLPDLPWQVDESPGRSFRLRVVRRINGCVEYYAPNGKVTRYKYKDVAQRVADLLNAADNPPAMAGIREL